MPTTSGMKPGGYYDSHSDAQRAAIDACLPWLVEAVAELPIAPHGESPLYLLDLGSSQGRNAIHVMRHLLDAIRRCTKAPVWLLFSDLPTNDFNRLFLNLFLAAPPVFTDAGVFPGALAGSAYKAVVPPQSLHVATSFNMIGWLDALPAARLPHYILPQGPRMPSDRAFVTEAENEPFRQQADADLRNFYHRRAQELVPGGKLLLQVFGRNDRYSTSDGLYDVMSDALLGLIDDGELPPRIYEDLIVPVYFRTLQELLAPIQGDEMLARAFRVDTVEDCDVIVPFNEELARTGDIQAWARSYTRFFRAVTEPVLAQAISETTAVADRLEEVYGRIERLLVTDPERYQFHYISVAALLTRL